MIAIARQIPDNPTTEDIEWFTEVRSHLQEVAERHKEELEGDDLTRPFIALARFYAGQTLLTQAKTWSEDCLKLTQRLFEGDHPHMATSLSNLALLYYAQGRLGEAEPLYRQALEMFERTLGANHSRTQMVRKTLTLFRQQMQQRERSTPPNPHLDRRQSLLQRVLRQIKRFIRQIMRSMFH